MGLEQWALDLAASPWIYLVMYLFAAIDGFFPPIPSESVVIALAALAVGPAGEPNLWIVVPVAALGAFTGDQIAFSIGRRVPVHRLRIFRSGRGQSALAWAERALERRGASFIIAARYIPVGRVAVNMTAGAVGFPRRRFTFLAAIAAVTWACYSTVIGVSAGAHDGSECGTSRALRASRAASSRCPSWSITHASYAVAWTAPIGRPAASYSRPAVRNSSSGSSTCPSSHLR